MNQLEEPFKCNSIDKKTIAVQPSRVRKVFWSACLEPVVSWRLQIENRGTIWSILKKICELIIARRSLKNVIISCNSSFCPESVRDKTSKLIRTIHILKAPEWKKLAVLLMMAHLVSLQEIPHQRLQTYLTITVGEVQKVISRVRHKNCLVMHNFADEWEPAILFNSTTV